MISIIDYGAGNVGAIQRLLRLSEIPSSLVSNPEKVLAAQRLLLPGVGAFNQTMRSLNEGGLATAIRTAAASGTPILGICIGMHALASSSEEGSEQGLNLIQGRVRRFDPATVSHQAKVPHTGWNSIDLLSEHPLFEGVDLDHGFYFLHSYCFEPTQAADTLTSSFHGGDFSSAVVHENVAGVQFHPEKSHDNGRRLLENFAAWVPC